MNHAGAPPWNVVAESLGLVRHEPMGSYERGTSFARLKRSLGPPAAGPARFHQWLHGKRKNPTGGEDEIEVLSILANLSDGVDNKTFVHAIARIDPPLLAGLQLTRRMGPYPAPIGEPRLDAMCVVQGLAPNYLLPLFQGSPEGAQLLDALQRLFEWGFHVSDSSVDVFMLAGVGPPPDLGARIDAAVLVAALIAKLRPRVPPLPGEEERATTWRAFGDSTHLSFDRERMILRGDAGAAKIQIRLEGEASGLSTVLVLELPQSLGAGLQLSRQAAIEAIANFFGATDIQIGDKLFDDMFLIKGEPNRVRWILQNNDLRRSLVELTAASRDIMMDDARLFVRWPMPVDDPAHLAGVVYRARAIANALFPAAPGPTPYR